jgi:transcriptional regulator with XRE-family HTH domain
MADMTAAELRTILSRLGLTQPQAAELLGVSLRAIESYLADGPSARAVPAPTAKLLRLLANGRVSLRQVRAA